MSEKHTPGPWMRTPDDANPGYWFIGTADDPHAVVGLDGEMSDPDARLIAATPDLLEALERIREIATEHACYLGDDAPQDEVLAVGGDSAIITEIGQIAGRVIANARGQG